MSEGFEGVGGSLRLGVFGGVGVVGLVGMAGVVRVMWCLDAWALGIGGV